MKEGEQQQPLMFGFLPQVSGSGEGGGKKAKNFAFGSAITGEAVPEHLADIAVLAELFPKFCSVL